MKIAFYAPMNAPDVGPASGDRSLARLFVRALETLGHEIVIAAHSTTYASAPEDHADLLTRARRERDDLLSRFRQTLPSRPDLWFTYHVYYRAPDVIGPAVSLALGIPYIVAEASDAPKHRVGPWAQSYAAARSAIASANFVFALTAHDRACLAQFVSPSRLVDLPPFIEADAFRPWRQDQRGARSLLRDQMGVALTGPVIVTVGMMRHRKKLDSYRMLAGALAPLINRPWTLVIVGDGEARADVEAAFATIPNDRIAFVGTRPGSDMAAFYGACDFYVWPGVEEAFGVAFLEAQATARPVIAQRTRGIPSVVEDGVGGLLTPVGDVNALTTAICKLLDDQTERVRLGRGGAACVDSRHTLAHASAILATHLEAATSAGNRHSG